MPIRLSFEKTVCGIQLLILRYCTPSNCGIALSEVKEMLKKHISRQDLRYCTPVNRQKNEILENLD